MIPMSNSRFFTLGMKLAISAAFVLLASALMLFVLPGFVIYQAGDLPFGHHFGEVHGDSLLPIAMQTQLLWAPAIPVLYAAVRKSAHRIEANGSPRLTMQGKLGATLAFVCGLYAWAVLLASFFHSQSGPR